MCCLSFLHNCLHMPRGGTMGINKAFVVGLLALVPDSPPLPLPPWCPFIWPQSTDRHLNSAILSDTRICVCVCVQVSFQVCVHMTFTVCTRHSQVSLSQSQVSEFVPRGTSSGRRRVSSDAVLRHLVDSALLRRLAGVLPVPVRGHSFVVPDG